MPDLIIRRANSGDALAIDACVQAAYQKYVVRMDKSPGPMLDDFAQAITNHHVAIAESDVGALVGLVILIEEDASILLDNIAVHPTMQGQGFGRRLLQYAEQQARALGYAELNLYTHECMTENIDLYHRLEYLDVEERSVNGYARIYMRKTLV